MDKFHQSVLLYEAIDFLKIKPGNRYIDATLGGGGHALGILELGGRVLGMDVDQEAIEFVRFKIQDSRFKSSLNVIKGNFREIDELARGNGFEEVAGIIFDLGVSSHQLDNAKRGFSFAKVGPLDMRMDLDLNLKALDLLKVLSKGELYELFKKFGEERFAKRVAANIAESRRVKPIATTKDLAELIGKTIPFREKNRHPATRAFQALRIAVNDEIGCIIDALPKALSILEGGGRIVVISFHSLEDRIVKQTFTSWVEKNWGTVITKKPIMPSEVEISGNHRSRSAKMRVFEKK